MSHSLPKIIAGIDTHKDFHHVAVISALGEELGDLQFPTTPAGYADILAFLRSHGTVIRVGIEGTGSYGAAITKRLQAAGMTVIDVIAPDKQERRLRGKTDQIDAYSAARAVLSRRASTIPKQRDGAVEAIRIARTYRKMLVKQRTELMNQLKAFLVTSPESFRERFSGLTGVRLTRALAALVEDPASDIVTAALIVVLRSEARRHIDLTTETDALNKALRTAVTSYAPELLAVHGVGPDVACSILVAGGQNIGRLHSEGALAHLVGTAPVPASSGKTTRFRLNKGGNRDGNAAFHRIVLVRMKSHPATRDYVTKTLARGKTKRDAMRLLKRYVAREIFPILQTINARHADQIAA